MYWLFNKDTVQKSSKNEQTNIKRNNHICTDKNKQTNIKEKDRKKELFEV